MNKPGSSLFILDLIQDIDILLPIILEFKKNNYKFEVIASTWLIENSRRTRTMLDELQIHFHIFTQKDILKWKSLPFDNLGIVFFGAESNLPPHRTSHHIAKIANRKSCLTCTFQHGLDNIGLTYFDRNIIKFNSQYIFTWHNNLLHNKLVHPETKQKIIPIGAFKYIHPNHQLKDEVLKYNFHSAIGIFENLHWDRYSNNYRNTFLENLDYLCNYFPDQFFYLKPHQAGKWSLRNSSKFEKLLTNENFIIIDIENTSWENISGLELASYFKAIITTPSTIAIDAAITKTHCAVITQNLKQLSNYKGIIRLTNQNDWIKFIQLADKRKNISGSQEDIENYLDSQVLKINPFNDLFNFLNYHSSLHFNTSR